MKINFKRIGLLSASVVTTGMIGLGGVAAADGASWSGGQYGRMDMGGRSEMRFDGLNRENRLDRFNQFDGFGGFSRPGQDRFSELNNNDVRINNTSDQTAITGDAAVFGNKFGGSARSGDATNLNSSEFDVNILNR
ncbi:MAG: hypothetical protein JWO35_872 [Candidatus Saccharibacteria bacterium]|nr:hypothetical protein [Candidatus Saccharibacteria bacterium]